MRNLVKKLAVVAALLGLWCGFVFAEDGAAYIVEDTTREILSTLNSRLDAYRKVRLPEAVIPAAEPAAVAAEPAEAEAGAAAEAPGAAYGSLAFPVMNYGERYLNRFWGGGLGTWQNAGRRNGSEDFAGYKYAGKGVILGFERAQGAATFGIAASYVKGDYKEKWASRHDSEIKQYSGSVYATYNNSRGFFFTLMGGYTYSDSEINEWNSSQALHEDYKSNTWSAGAKMGFDFEPSATVVITPSIGANFFLSKLRSHDLKTGAGLAGRLDGMKHNMVEIPLDVTVAKEFDFGGNRSLQLSASGGYAYNLNDKGVVGDFIADGTSSVERVSGRKQGRSAWKAGTGVRLKMDQWDIGFKYDYLRRGGFNAHRVAGTVGFSF